MQLDEERSVALRRDDYFLDHGAEDLDRLRPDRRVLLCRF